MPRCWRAKTELARDGLRERAEDSGGLEAVILLEAPRRVLGLFLEIARHGERRTRSAAVRLRAQERLPLDDVETKIATIEHYER